jgi:phosphoribosylanthranilate isomerase
LTRIKICGLTRAADAEIAILEGADALGFIFERSSPRFVGDGELPWVSALPPIPVKVAVFGRVDRPVSRSLFDVIQGVEWDCFPEPSPKRIHVIRPQPGQSAKDVMSTMIHSTAVMLDAYAPNRFGGTGHRVDTGLAAEIVKESRIPVILAGGLTPENVGDIVQKVRPFAVDVSSGVEERPGVKDHVKIRDFIQAVQGALR